MKTLYVATAAILVALLLGCAEDETSTGPERTFSGITERNEWGDTLSVDSTDWVILGGIIPPSSSIGSPLPFYQEGKQLMSRNLNMPEDQIEYSIGAFPNPFIPGGGHLLLQLVLPIEGTVQLHAENESGDINVTIIDALLPVGVHLLSWSGKDETGQDLPDGTYRIFFQAGLVSSFGDVQVYLSGEPSPSTNADYVIYAQTNYLYGSYVDYEYEVATTFGPDGELGGNDVLTMPKSTWELWDFSERFLWLPVFMSYDLISADPFQYHYLLAYKHFQFGAGWPDAGDTGTVNPGDPQWQKSNSYHNTYLDMYPYEEGGPW